MRYPEKEFKKAIEDYNNILICIKGSPDPDAIASGFALKILCERHGKKVRIAATQPLSLHQNRLFVRKLSIVFELTKSFDKYLGWADAYAVVDHASAEVEGLSEEIPCCIHIDHHEKTTAPFPISMRWCDTQVGSASTLIAELMESCYRELNISESEMKRISTALLFGIQTDTDKYALATDNDYTAIKLLSRFADTNLLGKLSGVPLSRKTAARLQKAERNKTIYKGWLITTVGYVPVKSRDDIAIIADFLLRREEVHLVVVFALIRNESKRKLTLDASVRSKDRALKLTPLIRRVATNGGGRKSKGAYQVDLDYFYDFSDATIFRQFVEKVTVEKLKRTRDFTYRVKIQSVIEDAKDAALNLFTELTSSLPNELRVPLGEGLWSSLKKAKETAVLVYKNRKI